MPISIVPSIDCNAGLQPKAAAYSTTVNATGFWNHTVYTIPANKVYHITSCLMRITSGAATSLYAQTHDGAGNVELFILSAAPTVNAIYGGVYDIYGDASQIVEIGMTVTTQPCGITVWFAGALFNRGEFNYE